MELKIFNHEEGQLQEIKWNNEAIKKEVAEKVEKYKNIVYTDDDIKSAKTDRATLNKFVKALEDKRKEIKKDCLKPYEEFEKQVKEIVAIINEPIQLIDGQVKEYEDRQKEEKFEKVQAIFEEEAKKCNMEITLEKIFDDRFLNASYSLKKVQDEIHECIEKINVDLSTIDALSEFSFEAKEEYKRSLDINRAISEGQRLADIQKRKQEAEEAARQKLEADIATGKTEDENQKETVKTNINDSEDIENMAGYTEPKRWIAFQANMNSLDAILLKIFFEENGIEFKQVKGEQNDDK